MAANTNGFGRGEAASHPTATAGTNPNCTAAATATATLTTYLAFSNAIKVNTIIYGITHLPFIKKVFTARLYTSKGLLLAERPDRSLLDPALGLLMPIFLSIFFSVHYLTMYYLLQPYTAATEMKNPLYSLVSGGTYLVSYAMVYANLPLTVLAPLCLLFCVLYCVAAAVAVYKLAPRTSRIKA